MRRFYSVLYSVLALAVVLALGVAPGANAEPSGKLTVSVIGVRSDSGAVRCGLYSSPGGFREPGHELRGAVAQIKNGLAACVFNGLPAGTYAVAVFHAEHNETQMETGLFGKPKQGYGFSNNPASTFGPPSFNSAAFEYKGGSLNLPAQSSAGDGGSAPHDMHASGTQALTGGLSPQMDPSAQYRRFAEECRRLVEQVESERHRRILHEMALAWSKLADESERAGLQPST